MVRLVIQSYFARLTDRDDQFAQHAVHAGMAGKTGLLTGRWHSAFVPIPIPLATQSRRKVDPQSELWHAVLESTGQPAHLA